MKTPQTPEEAVLLNFLNRSRPKGFFDPKFINMGIAETSLRQRAKKNAARPGNFFNEVADSKSESSLSKLFRQQADNLLDLQFDKYVQVERNVFWEHTNKLADLVNGIKPRKDCIPFLIVIPEYVMNRQKQASRIGIDCQSGGSKLFNKGGLPNMPGVLVPKLPYLAVNVNMGMEFTGLSPDEARKKFGRWWRWNKLLPLTVDEGFAVATHAREVLKSNTIDLIGTQFGTNGVAGLMNKDDGLWITFRANNFGARNRAPAFCYNRLAP